MWGEKSRTLRGEFPSLGPEGVEVLGALLDRSIPIEEGERQLRACQKLLEGTVEELGPLLGHRGVSAVFARALVLARTTDPALASSLVVTRDRIEFLPDARRARGTIAPHFCRLYLAVMEVTTSLIGFDLVEPILRRIDLRSEPQGQSRE